MTGRKNKKDWQTTEVKALAQAFLMLRRPEEAEAFLRDLLTLEELAEFGRRWQAAQMLDRRVPYLEIQKKTGLSSTTVARVQRWLQRGEGGYRLVLDRQGKKKR